MARPPIPKRICKEPVYTAFGPIGMEACENPKSQSTGVTLTLDEYETLRWIDLEGISREECARRMNIARTTAQAIYDSASRKVAESIVHGLELHIEGGSFRLCDGSAGCPKCKRLQANAHE